MFDNIYDIGANQGQNIKYFLQNGKKVVAVEPIKELCSKINKNFNKSIDSGQLSILNSAVVVDEDVKITFTTTQDVKPNPIYEHGKNEDIDNEKNNDRENEDIPKELPARYNNVLSIYIRKSS